MLRYGLSLSVPEATTTSTNLECAVSNSAQCQMRVRLLALIHPPYLPKA